MKEKQSEEGKKKTSPLLCSLLSCLFCLQVIFLKITTKNALNLGYVILHFYKKAPSKMYRGRNVGV